MNCQPFNCLDSAALYPGYKLVNGNPIDSHRSGWGIRIKGKHAIVEIKNAP
jgi:hypothetical protein